MLTKLEIERKWVVKSVPPEIDLEVCDPVEINQGYLTDENGKVIRYRRKGDKFYKTHKSPTDNPAQRLEDEVEITEEDFNAKWPQTEGCRIRKFRYHIEYGDKMIELDVFLGDNVGHMMAEVEFETTDASDAFEPPTWLEKKNEVTEDARYGNAEIAIHGWPKPV